MRFFDYLSEMFIYQGRSAYNKGSKYWSTDREWTRQFTQSGLDKEIAVSRIDPKKIYKKNPLPSATNAIEIEEAIEEARKKGYLAIWLDEGVNEPNSIYII